MILHVKQFFNVQLKIQWFSYMTMDRGWAYINDLIPTIITSSVGWRMQRRYGYLYRGLDVFYCVLFQSALWNNNSSLFNSSMGNFLIIMSRFLFKFMNFNVLCGVLGYTGWTMIPEPLYIFFRDREIMYQNVVFFFGRLICFFLSRCWGSYKKFVFF